MMPNSPLNRHSDPQKPENSTTQKRICDFCCESTALLYCRADSAKLCFSCDREVHSTNPLFTKHTRFQLCDVCDSSPASILCFTEHSVLCQNCDFEVHSLLGTCTAHDRRPLEGFSGCPSALELSGHVGFEGFDGKCSGVDGENDGFGGGLLSGLEEDNDGFSDLLAWDTPCVVNIDELIASTNKDHCFQATVVRPLSKDRNLSCGQHKQEILHQLYKLAKSDPNTEQDFYPLVGLHTVPDENEKDFMMQHMIPDYLHDEEQATLQGHEARPCTWDYDANEVVNDVLVSSALSGSHFEGGVLHSDRPSSISGSANPAMNGCDSQNPIGSEPLSSPAPKVAIHEFNSAERDSALSRYKEKRRTRRYDKHVRYESRKVQAEHRVRIRGRFAKMDPLKKRA